MPWLHICRIDNVSWRIDEAKKDTWKREENMDTKLFRLQYKVEELTKSVTEAVAALSRRPDSGYEPFVAELGTSRNLESCQPVSFNGRRRVSEDILGRQSFASGPAPRRFLSHNPYMHMPVYQKNAKVKEAAWSFRRTSLKSSRPSKEELMQALANQETLEGEDTIDAPPQPSQVCFL